MSHDLERIRDYVEGRLPDAEREAFAAEIRRDAALQELVETYELVVRATADAAPGSTATFGDLMLRAKAARRFPLPLLAAAAAVLLVAAGAWLFAGDRPGQPVPKRPGPLELASIPLKALPAPEAPPEWPRELLSHATADEEGLVWYDDLEAASAVSRAAKAPIFLFIHFPGCDWCRDFRVVQCRDEAVIKAADPFVLVTLHWAKAPVELREDPGKGWPIFDLLDEDGKRIDGFKGMRSAAEVAAWLEERATSPRPDWKGLGETARRLEEAEAAEDPAVRFALYRQVAAADNVLGKAARVRLAAMEKEAQDALFAAREEAGRLGTAAAADRLGAAEKALEGTPYAADLARVRGFLREHGSFPELKE